MIKRIEEKLDESQLLCEILKGLSISLSIAMIVLLVASGVLTFVRSAWWAIGFVLSMMGCGICFGVAVYLFDEY